MVNTFLFKNFRVASNLNKRKISDLSFVSSTQILTEDRKLPMPLEELEELEEDLLTSSPSRLVLTPTEEPEK
jgi:hypothetical protein